MNKEYRTHSKDDELNWERDILPIYKNIISKLSFKRIEYINFKVKSKTILHMMN
jgi:hypothetical protein